jgi:AcrR family transcriptional regulator
VSDTEPTESADGRTARRDRNREAVLDAVLDLFADGSLAPAPAEVAERSGVSLRSVYRYFDDMDSLVRAAIARNLDRMAPLFALPEMGEGPVDQRIERIVTGRLRLYEGLAPIARAAVARADANALIRERLEETRLFLRRQVEEMFAPELQDTTPSARVELVAAVDVLLGLESLEHLFRHRGLSTPVAQAVLVRAVGGVLATRS